MIDAFILAWHWLTIRAYRPRRHCRKCNGVVVKQSPVTKPLDKWQSATMSDWDWSYDDQA